MAYLSTQVRIDLAFPDGTSTADLANNSISWEKVYNEDYGYSIIKIKSVTFCQDQNETFRKLYDIEKDLFACTEVELLLYTLDNSQTATLRQTYALPVRKGDWDIDNNVVSMEPRLKHNFTELEDNIKQERNLLNTAEKQTLKFIQGEIQTEICFESAPPNPPSWTIDNIPVAGGCPDLTIAKGWTVVLNELGGVTKIDNTEYPELSVFRANLYIQTTYKREFISGGSSPGAEWIEVDGGWARPLTAVYNESRSTTFVDPGSGELEVFYPTTIRQVYDVAGLDTDTGEPITIDNGVKLERAIEFFVGQWGLSIVSDFFNINPDNTHPENQAYDYAEEFLQDILIFQASDVIRASAFNNATRMVFTFEQLWANLRRFGVQFIAAPDGTLRIEHVSYRTRGKKLSLLQVYDLIKGKGNYSYNKSKKPRFERFEDKYPTDSIDFDDAYIEYDAICSDPGPNNEETITAPNTVCNLAYLFDNELLYEDFEKMKDTMVFVATKDGAVTYSIGNRSGDLVMNGALSWANIIHNLWLWDRPQAIGLVNGVSTEFVTSLPIREQETLTVPMSIEDFFDNFSVDDMVKTQLGWCELGDVSYTLPSGLLEITPKF